VTRRQPTTVQRTFVARQQDRVRPRARLLPLRMPLYESQPRPSP
jgi:hypothetical protein